MIRARRLGNILNGGVFGVYARGTEYRELNDRLQECGADTEREGERSRLLDNATLSRYEKPPPTLQVRRHMRSGHLNN